MKRGMITLLAVLSLAAFVSGGCANKEVVKTEEPAAVTARAEAPKPEPAAPAAANPVKQPDYRTEEPRTVAAKPAAEPVAAVKEVAAVSSLETIYFDFDKSELRQDARNVLSKNADILQKSKQGAKVRIEGHCDERGSAEYNLALGERRAKSVLQYLLTLGVQADRLSVISYGKEKPAVQGTDEAAWAKNRRAEFVVSK